MHRLKAVSFVKSENDPKIDYDYKEETVSAPASAAKKEPTAGSTPQELFGASGQAKKFQIEPSPYTTVTQKKKKKMPVNQNGRNGSLTKLG